MKTAIVIVLSLLACAASGFSETVKVVDPSCVIVNGENFGKVADAIANNKSLAPDVQRALEKWYTDFVESQTKDAKDRVSQVEAVQREAGEKVVEANRKVEEADSARKSAEERAKVAETKLKAIIAAVDIGNKAVLDAEVEAAKRTREEEREYAIKAQIEALKAEVKE